MRFPIAGMLKPLIKYISDVLESVAPDQLSEGERRDFQKHVGTIYAAAKFYGPDAVAKTDNDLDDAILAEVFDICEKAAVKYNLELNPVALIYPAG